jgi:Putative phage tail protein
VSPRRAVAKPDVPPDYYFSPKLGGDPDVPRPSITARTASAAQDVSISGEKALVELGYGIQRLVAGPDRILYAYKPDFLNEFWYIIPLSEGETGNLTSVRVSSQTLDGTSAVYPTIRTGGINVWYRSGDDTQPIDPVFRVTCPTWTETLPGAAYLLVRLFGLDYFWRNGPPTLEIVYEGLLCLDPRDNVRRFTRNTVLQLYDFARRKSGKALDAALINTATIITGANIADELMPDGTRRYESDVTIRDAADVEDWIKTFRLLCDGFFTWREGQFHLIIDRGVAATSDLVYTDADLVDDGEAVFERAEPADAVNHVRVIWVDPSSGWTEVPHDEETEALKQGLEERVTATYRLPWIRSAGRAKRLAVFLLNAFQYDGKLSIRWAGTTTRSVVGDVITQSVPKIALAPQRFRVLQRTLLADNSYDVLLGEYSDTRYSDAVVATSSRIASTAPDADSDPPDLSPADIVVTENQYDEQSGVVKTRAIITYTLPAGYPFVEAVELYSDAAGGGWTYITDLKSSPGVAPLHEVERQFNFLFKVRSIFGRRSAGIAFPFTARGKTLPPSNVPIVRAAVNDGRVTLRWQKSTDLDLLGYEVRRRRGDFSALTGTDLLAAWDAATPIGKPDALMFEDEPPYGPYTYFVCAFDSGKRYSALPAVCFVTNEPVGRYTEVASSLDVHNSLASLPDFYKGVGSMVVEGVNSGRLQFLLSREDTWDDIAAYMSANGLATLDDYDRVRNAAELCFPLPATASGTVAGLGTTVGGTSTRNLEYRVRVAREERIGRSSFSESHQIAEPFCGSQFGSKFTAGAYGMHPRFGLHLSTNDPWAQVIVRAEGEPIFYVTTRRIEVFLGVYDATTGSDGRAVFTLPADKQLGASEIVSVDARALYSSAVQLVPEDETNATFTVRAYSSSGTPLPDVPVRATVWDRGVGGTFSVVAV